MSTEQLDLSGFTRVDIKGAFRFEVVRADRYSVGIERSWLMHPRVDVRGDTLVIYEPWYDVAHWLAPWRTPWAKVEMPGLRELRVSGASRGSATGFNSSQEFRLMVQGASHLTGEIKAGASEMDVAGASQLQLAMSASELKVKVAGASRIKGELKADKGDIQVAGASRIGVKGAMGEATINVAGASRLDMDDFTIRNANIKLAGASQCRVKVNGKMDAELAGASRLVYGGNPVMGNVRAVGASQLERK